MQIMRILVGLPGSGKSTYAEGLVAKAMYEAEPLWHRVNYDSIRWFDSDGSPRDYQFSKKAEEEIKTSAISGAISAVTAGWNLLIDNTNLSQNARQLWIDFAVEHKMKLEVVEFNTDLDECLRRNALRTGWARVPRPAIERMALFSGRVTWPDAPVVLVDIDGTLMDGTHRQKYLNNDYEAAQGQGPNEKFKKDWKMYFSLIHLDSPIKPVIEWVRCLKDEGYHICLVSGRGLEHANETTDQMEKHGVTYDRIFMRNAGDSREDSIIKKEILDKITPHALVAFAIDNRPRVIRMWKENGIRVYDVGKGIEF